MAKKIDQRQIAAIDVANDANDPGPSKRMLECFIKGVNDGFRLDVIIADMAKIAEEELDA